MATESANENPFTKEFVEIATSLFTMDTESRDVALSRLSSMAKEYANEKGIREDFKIPEDLTELNSSISPSSSMATESANEKLFHDGLMKNLLEQHKDDVLVKGGDSTYAIPAHRLVLAARSKVFKYALEISSLSSMDTESTNEELRDISLSRLSSKAKEYANDPPTELNSSISPSSTMAARKKSFRAELMRTILEEHKADLWVKAGDSTYAIPAHSLILAGRSEVFKKSLELLDKSKVSPDDPITLSELRHDELEAFLDFMYHSFLPHTKVKQHARALYIAAQKYKIPYLQDICRDHLIDSMNRENVFEVLEVAKIVSEDDVSNFLASHMNEMMSSMSASFNFLSFVKTNPALAAQTIRDYMRGNRRKPNSGLIKVPELPDKKSFYEGQLTKVFEEKWEADVLVKAGDNTNAIHAHKLILGARSKVLKDILEASSDNTITISEMRHDELKTFLEFLYDGVLPGTKLAQHALALYKAAQNYQILHLQDICRDHLIDYMDASNVDDLDEVAEIYSDKTLKAEVSRKRKHGE